MDVCVCSGASGWAGSPCTTPRSSIPTPITRSRCCAKQTASPRCGLELLVACGCDCGGGGGGEMMMTMMMMMMMMMYRYWCGDVTMSVW
eukprot:2241762-Rhodomonas_salina.2